jgi:hypothetical protein
MIKGKFAFMIYQLAVNYLGQFIQTERYKCCILFEISLTHSDVPQLYTVFILRFYVKKINQCNSIAPHIFVIAGLDESPTGSNLAWTQIIKPSVIFNILQ